VDFILIIFILITHYVINVFSSCKVSFNHRITQHSSTNKLSSDTIILTYYDLTHLANFPNPLPKNMYEKENKIKLEVHNLYRIFIISIGNLTKSVRCLYRLSISTV